MKKLLLILIVLFSSPFIVKAASLPNCGYDATYLHNCSKSVKYDNGESYIGEWRNDKPHGMGLYKGNEDGIDYVFRGEFKNGLPDGLMFLSLNGKKYFQGELNEKAGLILGIVTFNKVLREVKKWKNLDPGDTYVGEIKNNAFDGEGAFLDFSEGVLKIGTWRKNELISPTNDSSSDYEIVPYSSANSADANNAYTKSMNFLNRGEIVDATYWLMRAARNNHKKAITKYQAVQKMRDMEKHMSVELRRRSDNRKKVTNWWDVNDDYQGDSRPTQSQENKFEYNMKKVVAIATIAILFGDDPATAFNTAFEAVFGTGAETYDGPCPCPYSIASDGSRCGERSAYSRTGGAAPACY